VGWEGRSKKEQRIKSTLFYQHAPRHRIEPYTFFLTFKGTLARSYTSGRGACKFGCPSRVYRDIEVEQKVLEEIDRRRRTLAASTGEESQKTRSRRGGGHLKTKDQLVDCHSHCVYWRTMSSSQNGPSAEMNGGTAEEDEASLSKTGPTGSVMDGGRRSSYLTAPLGQNEPPSPNLTVSKIESALSQETRRESINTPAGSEGTNLSRNSSKVDSPPASKKRRLSVINKVMKRMELAKVR
jgi:hypothetical protein